MRNVGYPSIHVLSVIGLLAVAGCGDDDAIGSDEEARRAYLGLDGSIEKALDLGFDGFNSANSANIDPQTGDGDETGTLTITGQVDQGASANKEMRLYVGMVDYSDGILVVEADDEEVELALTYDTSDTQDEQPFLHLSLRDIPDGTFTGELTGAYQLSGDIDGEVELDLTLAGEIQSIGGDGVDRVPGTTAITGTATSGDGLYDVDLTI
jgi:hypothetical protein